MSFKIIMLLIVLIVLYFIFFRGNNKKPTYKVSKTDSKNLKNQYLKVNPEHEKSSQSLDSNSNIIQNPREVPDGFLNFNVNIASDLNQEKTLEVINIAKRFKKPNPVLLMLIKGAFEPHELFDLIKADPKMTAKILNAVNSPLFALRTPITSIQHAINFMGVNAIKNVVMQITVQDALKFENPQQEKAYQKLSKASYMASAFCLLLAKELGKENAAELSTRCLLCYLGDMAMLSNEPLISDDYLLSNSLYERVNKAQESYGFNSAIVGKVMAQEWSLPDSIINGIGNSLLTLSNASLGSDISNDELQDNLLCYIACRVGDFFAFNHIKDISSINGLGLNDGDPIEFYYLQNKINLSGLQHIKALFNDSIFIRKVNTLLKTD
ncbi:HDOD domain-containing protein [Pseudocolwellia agarivorans]|uniref:HDOD domain-containing protein n=1 Tax=Pseudocolwellia agarivorans TaxID=1911682 RepID=UPI000987180A|nr:HDOD domain-containing protein [Pseudocolwellia agarivorans]